MRRLRFLVHAAGGGRTTVEITARALHGRHLLKPDSVVNNIIIGVLARAAERYDVEVNANVFLSNHFHLALTIASQHELSRFMQYVMSNIARKIGRYRGWNGRFWQRRYQCIEISPDEESLVARIDYILRNGVKEGLVSSPYDWPGVHCAWALASGLCTQRGWWEDQTKAFRLRNAGKRVRTKEIRTDCELELKPLPCWEHKDKKQIRDWFKERVQMIVDEAKGLPVLGVKKILAQPVEDKPKKSKRTYAPDFHTKHAQARKDMREAYRTFVKAFYSAAARLEKFLKPEDDPYFFPSGCQPPLPRGVPETA